MTVRGTKSARPATENERRFDLDGLGGEFIVRGDEAEVTMFGSGVPVLSSERGVLVQR